jgi:hypothetical protein
MLNVVMLSVVAPSMPHLFEGVNVDKPEKTTWTNTLAYFGPLSPHRKKAH